jgi:uncharacterized protein (DUF2267 family)
MNSQHHANHDQNNEPEEMHFLHQLKKELLLENEQDAVPLVASVLQALRQTLSLENANALLNKLPDFLKLVFACNWPQNEPLGMAGHLDEFVTLVMERDQRDGKFIFKSELHTLSVVIITLKRLSKFVDIDKLEGIAPAFKHELQEAFTEEIAA